MTGRSQPWFHALYALIEVPTLAGTSSSCAQETLPSARQETLPCALLPQKYPNTSSSTGSTTQRFIIMSAYNQSSSLGVIVATVRSLVPLSVTNAA